MPIERKLAAIMFTDIAGYTALSAKDSTKASELLITQRDTLKPIVEKHGGSWMKEMGDGLLLTFDSATSAVECSIAIQQATKDIEDLNLRIGLHEGEVIKQDGDVIGDDVNVASRIEPFSAVGGVAITHKIEQAISSNKEFETSYVGKPELKGVSQKVEVYCIISHGLPKADEIVEPVTIESKPNFNIFALTGGILTAIGIAFWIAVGVLDVSFGGKAEVPSVGILMMENRGDEEDEFWASSITEDLIIKVAGAGLIRVAPMKEILEIDIKDSFEAIAKQLRVKYILTSSIYKKEDGFDLRCQLIEAESGNSKYANKWSESIDKAPTIVGNLAYNILQTLQVTTKQEITKSFTTITEAYEYYLKGKYKYEKRENMEDVEIARGLLKKAIELDDEFFLAKNQLAWSYSHFDDYDKAKEIFTSTLNQAKEIGDKKEIAYSLESLGEIGVIHNDLDSTLNYYTSSLKIHVELGNKRGIANIYHLISYYYKYKPPADLDSILYYSKLSLEILEELEDEREMVYTLITIGRVYRFEENWELALSYYHHALDLEQKFDRQHSLAYILGNIGILYEDKLDYDKALDYNIRTLKLFEERSSQSGLASAFVNIGNIYFYKGDLDSALYYYTRTLKLVEEFINKTSLASALLRMGIIYLDKGDYKKADEYLEKSFVIQKELGLGRYDVLETTTYLYLTYKYLGKEYNVKKIHSLIKDSENIEFTINFRLFQLIGDTSNLETAYNQVKEKADNLEPDVAAKFLSYPIPKAIVEEWEKVK